MLDPWRSIIADPGQLRDDLGAAQLAQALVFFRIGRGPEEARERARKVLDGLPLAVRQSRGVIWFDHLDEEVVLTRILTTLLTQAYADWIALRRATRLDPGIYLTRDTMLWWAQADFGSPDENQKRLSYQEQTVAFNKNVRDAYVYWNVDRPPFPTFNTGKRFEPGMSTKTFRLALHRSVELLSRTMLTLESEGAWDRVFRGGSASTNAATAPIGPVVPR